jgi:hypothetical protein
VVTVTTSPTEIKVGATRIRNRQAIMVYNDSNITIFYGPSASVSTTGSNKGFPLYKDQFFFFPIGDTPWYYVAGSTNSNVIVSEVP